MKAKVISVQFWRDKDNAYAGRQYSYFCTFPVKPGDLVRVPVGKNNEEKIAQVAETDIPYGRIANRILAVMKAVNGVEKEVVCHEAQNAVA